MIRFIVTSLAALLGLVLVFPALLILVPVWGFATMVRVLAAALARRSIPWNQIIQFEPEIGWKPCPNLNTRYADRNGDECTVQTDAEGWPGSHTIEESEVVVVGDSFAFGYGVPARRAYHAQTRRFRIKAISAPGYSMVQPLLLMRRYGPRLQGKVIVWFICLENDLADNLKPYTPGFYTSPFLRTHNGEGDWEIVSGHVQLSKWNHGDAGIGNIILFAYLCTQCPYSVRVFSASRHLILQAKANADAVGAHLIVFTVPYKKQLDEKGIRQLKGRLRNPEGFDPKYPDQQLSAICSELGVPFIPGSEHLTIADYRERDGHWNLQGNRKVAAVIESYCQRRAEAG